MALVRGGIIFPWTSVEANAGQSVRKRRSSLEVHVLISVTDVFGSLGGQKLRATLVVGYNIKRWKPSLNSAGAGSRDSSCPIQAV